MSRTLALISPVIGRGDGQGRVNYEIAHAALDAGYRVVVCAGACDPDLIDRGVRWFPLPLGPRRPKLLWLLRYNLATERTARHAEAAAGPIDLWVGNGVGLRRHHAVNIAHFVHSAWAASPSHPGRRIRGPKSFSQRCYTALNAYWERRAFARAERVVAVSDATADELNALGVQAHRSVTIHNGIDTSEFTARTPGHAAIDQRTALGLPSAGPLAFFAGDLKTNRKNLDTVLAALVKVPGLHLAVAGEARHSVYPTQAAKLGLADRVHFLGFRRDTAALMRACDLFVLPSRYDTFGLVILEAMASGLPVITSRRTGAASLVEQHRAGYVLDDQEDADACAEALKNLLADPQERDAMGRRARAAAEEQDWKRVAPRYIALLDALPATTEPPPLPAASPLNGAPA